MLKLGFFSKILVLTALGWAALTALPNVLPEPVRAAFPASFPQKTLNLGLDLQGGSHLVLQVDLGTVMGRAYENLEDEIRRELRAAQVGYTGLATQRRAVTFSLRDGGQRDAMTQGLRNIRGIQVDEGQQGRVTVRLDETEEERLQKTAVNQTVEVLRTRVDQFGVAEPLIQRQGEDRVIVELPGIDDVQRAKDAIGKTAQLTFHLVDAQADPTNPLALPPNRMVLYEEGIPLVVYKRPQLTGEMLTSAGAGFDQYSQPSVDIAFNSRGTRLFAKLSSENVGRQFAIVLDGKVLSAPVFREAILGGRAQITGSFTVQGSQDLATLLNAGALPAPVKVVEERTVGPSLGADSVAAGQLAIAIGFVAVLIFMGLFYGLFGLAADVALLFNVIIILAVMTAVGFTLTLPGMAGIVLTIGMAVDANVLIFERVREEIAKGSRPFTALENGFKGAFSTIMDANITTLLAAIVLFAMGSGPVRGFALTLSIGILASMFTAIMLTRWLLVAYVQQIKPKELKV